MREFGPEVVPLISERLRTARYVLPATDRETLLEGLIGELRWRGDAGAQALITRFGQLNDYGRSLACVVLGLLGAQTSRDMVWSFFGRAVNNQRESHFVGALWGLIDLKDERVSGALASLLSRGRIFGELFGFLSLVGDARAVVPLLAATAQLPGQEGTPAVMALAGVAHRIGRDAVLAQFDKVADPADPREDRERFADGLLSRPISVVEEYFPLLYRGLTRDDMLAALATEEGHKLSLLAAADSLATREDPRPKRTRKPRGPAT
jgi:hypothetical protein